MVPTMTATRHTRAITTGTTAPDPEEAEAEPADAPSEEDDSALEAPLAWQKHDGQPSAPDVHTRTASGRQRQVGATPQLAGPDGAGVVARAVAGAAEEATEEAAERAVEAAAVVGRVVVGRAVVGATVVGAAVGIALQPHTRQPHESVR